MAEERCQRTDGREHMVDDSWQRADGRGEMSEGRWQRTHGRGHMAESRWQRTDSRGQMTESRWQRTDGRGEMAEERWQRRDELWSGEERKGARGTAHLHVISDLHTHALGIKKLAVTDGRARSRLEQDCRGAAVPSIRTKIAVGDRCSSFPTNHDARVCALHNRAALQRCGITSERGGGAEGEYTWASSRLPKAVLDQSRLFGGWWVPGGGQWACAVQVLFTQCKTSISTTQKPCAGRQDFVVGKDAPGQ